MKILSCHISGFGCYADRNFDFCSELNPFCLNNGEGKTTLAQFIKAMFYSLEKSSSRSYDRKHYKPYAGGEYGGSIVIELDGKNYRIERTFADSPTRDTLTIYDDHGIQQNEFCGKKISELQGDRSSQLGELIFGVDSASFSRCHFISSDDLDFESNESIKNKIGNIVIDKEHENSFEDTYDSILSFDLREKAPTRKNENAYPYQITKLEKENKDKQDQIKGLNQLESDLDEMYQKRDQQKEELKEIEKKQKEYELIHVQKGKYALVKRQEDKIQEENDEIEKIHQKYKDSLPTPAELDSLDTYTKEYQECVKKDKSFKITSSEIERLSDLDGRVVSDEEHSALTQAYGKIEGLGKNNGLIELDERRYQELKSRFEGKEIKDRDEVEKLYRDYTSLKTQESVFLDNYHPMMKEYPSENVLDQIQHEIQEYNQANQDLNTFRESYKEVSPLVKVLLILVTFGIYFLILNNRKKQFNQEVERRNRDVSRKAVDLDAFFIKYQKPSGSYACRLEELRDEITRYERDQKESNEKEKKHLELQKQIREKKSELEEYFQSFGYPFTDIDIIYDQYKKDDSEYLELSKDVQNNERIKEVILKQKDEQYQIIDEILGKYQFQRQEDFSSQLAKLKADLEFQKRYAPIYQDKMDNDCHRKEEEGKILAILNGHQIQRKTDLITTAMTLMEDMEKLKVDREAIAKLMMEKEDFIKANHLEGFAMKDTELEEEDLRKDHALKTGELNETEAEINAMEEKISQKESLQQQIEQNKDLIQDYEGKIRIARLAAKALDEAHREMDDKYIRPIKDSFISYASQINQAIGSDFTMDYDYHIKYDIHGHNRDSQDLSDGERTIMMLALRFSVLDSMYPDHDSVIILDDPFESLDPEKLDKAKELIRSLSKDWQIIYFTCHDSRAIHR